MNHRERFDALMNFQTVDRLPRIEWAGYWNETTERWYEEGLDPSLNSAQAIRESLGLDPYSQFWMGTRGPRTPRPDQHLGGIISDTDGYNRICPTLYNHPDYGSERFQQVITDADSGERVVWITLDGFFWGPRIYMGVENHMMGFYDQPELLHQMNQDILAFNLEVIDRFCDQVCTPAFMTVAEDMSYNNGPMLSETHFNEFLAPYYLKLTAELKQRGIRIFVDSDGDVMPLIPWLRAVGVEGILPLERMAGVDVAQIRREHPDWLMIGGYDKTVMKDGENAQRQEFERLLPVMQTGGFIPSVDHQTPPDVSLDTYRTYLSLLNDYS